MKNDSSDLSDYLKAVSQQLGDEYLRIQKRSKEDPGTAGDQGEENWSTLFKNWLPPIFQIVTKGRILGHSGEASPQVDLLILQPEYPKHLLDKKLYLAGGVLAAFECKVNLRSKDIDRFVENSVKIKSLTEIRVGTPFKELQTPIVYGLLAHSHDWKKQKSNPCDNIENNLRKSLEKRISHPIQMPDLICVADLGVWSLSKIVFINSQKLSEQIPNFRMKFENEFGKVGVAATSYISYSHSIKDQIGDFIPVGAAISLLLHKLSWMYPNLRTISRYFTLSNISGNGQGVMKYWPPEIYTNEVFQGIKNRKLKNPSYWDEWGICID